MTCTHATCQTAFCPHCGIEIARNSGTTLLAFLRIKAQEPVYCTDPNTRLVYIAKVEAWESWVAAHIAKDAGEGGASEA